jgi:hypothetical protein
MQRQGINACPTSNHQICDYLDGFCHINDLNTVLCDEIHCPNLHFNEAELFDHMCCFHAKVVQNNPDAVYSAKVLAQPPTIKTIINPDHAKLYTEKLTKKEMEGLTTKTNAFAGCAYYRRLEKPFVDTDGTPFCYVFCKRNVVNNTHYCQGHQFMVDLKRHPKKQEHNQKVSTRPVVREIPRASVVSQREDFIVSPSRPTNNSVRSSDRISDFAKSVYESAVVNDGWKEEVIDNAYDSDRSNEYEYFD